MLLYLSYERNRKQWNFRMLILLLICVIGWGFFSFSVKPSPEESHFPILPSLPNATSGELNLVTYNVAGLPEIISSAKTERSSSIQLIGERLKDFDIVNVQEDFNYNNYLYQKNKHPYRTKNKGAVPFGDGLSTLSKYPIQWFQRVAWEDCNGADCLTPKGFSFATIQLAPDVFVDVYNVHATAQDDLNAALARQKNIQQLERFIATHSSCNALLIMGDFNAHYAYKNDKLKVFQENLDLLDAWVILNNNAVFPQVNPAFTAKPALQLNSHCESIDKIYFRNSDQLLFSPQEYRLEKDLFSTEEGEALSDHCAIALKLKWEMVK